MRKEIVNVELGITETDIKNCNDSYKLQEWKTSIVMQSSKVKDKLMKMKNDYKNDLESDADEYRRTQGFKRILSVLLLQIQARQAELKSIRCKNEDRLLIEIFKEILPGETFRQGIEILRERKGNYELQY